VNSIDVKSIDDKVSKFIEERDWDQFHSIKNLVMALSVEASELVEIFQWSSEEVSNQVNDDEKLKQKVSEEIADIFIYLMRIAKKSGIDIEKSCLDKVEANSQKYPVSKSKGSSKKYTEL
tara:strand:+ start:39 stop:398 length:360 start_codon:yes stop_codon:yes gene_type:complete